MNKAWATVMLLLIAGSGFSQGHELELVFRPALTSVRGNEVILENFDPTFNFSGGVGFNYFTKSNALLTVGLLYDKKGGRKESTVGLVDENNQPAGEATLTSEVNFDYLTIPMQWGKRFGKKIKFQWSVGLYASFLLKQESVTKILAFSSIEDESDSYGKTDFGLSASFYSYLPLNEKLSVKVGLDDLYGLANVRAASVPNEGSIKHNSLGVSAGLTVKLN